MPDQSEPWMVPRRLLCVNRGKEIQHASSQQKRASARDEPTLIQLAGPRGIGKTVLAIHLAYQFQSAYPDGGLFLEAQGSDPQAAATVADLARQVLVQMGFALSAIPGAEREVLAMARGATARKRMVIVVDDVRMLEQIEGLLGDISFAAVIVTTRSRLDALTTRQQFVRIDLSKFDVDATGALITAITGTRFPVAVVHALQAKCAGLPLALAIGVGRIAAEEDDPERFVAELSLPDFEQDGEPSVAAVFDAIYHDLPAAEQRDYELLSVVPGPDFGIPVAAAALQASERDVRHTLQKLVARYLIEDRGKGRFRFHDLVREHASGLAWETSPDAARKAEKRSVSSLVYRAVALDRAYSRRAVPQGGQEFYDSVAVGHPEPMSAEVAATEFEADWSNFLAAARACADLRMDEFAVVIPAVLYTFAYQTRRAASLVDLYLRALDLARTDPLRWQLNRDLAGLHEQLGDGEAVLRYADAALHSGYQPGRASALEWHALGYELLGKFAEARASLREALDALPLMRDPVHEERGGVLIRMHDARISVKEGRSADVGAALAEACRYYVASGDLPNVARCERLIGDLDYRQGLSREAEAHWLVADESYERARMLLAAAEVLDSLADLAEKEGEHDKAEQFRERAARLRSPG